MLSSLSLCIPREWRLYFSVLSGPLCHYRFRKAPARQAAGGDTKGSPSGEVLEGESPRGGDREQLRGKPPTILVSFLRKMLF